jgi:hypothetical protein
MKIGRAVSLSAARREPGFNSLPGAGPAAASSP